MSQKINIQSIRKYNPSVLKDQDVINNFIVRQKTFSYLIEQIKNESKSSIPQHHLIIGQRGMGKTTLLKRIEVELRTDPQLSKKYIPLQFPEELYNIDRLSKFWLNTIDVLLDYLEETGEIDLINKFLKKREQLNTSFEKENISEIAYQLFLEITSALGKRPVFLIDNLDSVFSGISDEEQWQLREKMSKPSSSIYIGASAAPFDAVFEYKQAFYDYFRLITLDSLTYSVFDEFIRKLAEGVKDDKIRDSFYTNQNRIITLFALTGGNIRTAVIIFLSMIEGFGLDVSNDLEKLMDEMTPIYKARMDELSGQMKIIIDAVAMHWDPLDLKKLREITMLDNNTLSPQIRRLRQMGWISTIPSKKSKGDKYEMAERFFNVWYLMRISTRRNKKNIICLSRFLEEYYGAETNQFAMSLLSQPIREESDVIYLLALSEAVKDIDIRNKLLTNAHLGLENLSKNDQKILKRFDYSDNPNLDLEEFFTLEKAQKHQEAANWLKEKINAYPERAELHFYFGYLNHEYLFENNLAEDSYIKSTLINPNNEAPYHNLGNLYQYNFTDYEKAKNAYIKALNINPNFALSWYGLGDLYITFDNDYKEAEKAFLKAITNDKKFVAALSALAKLYKNNFKDYKKAEATYIKAINIIPTDVNNWNDLGNLYQYNLNKYKEAKESYLKAINLDPNIAGPWIGLGILYKNHYKDFNNSEKAFLKAIENENKNKYAWNGLGNLYLDNFKEYEKAKEAYLKVIEIDPNLDLPWIALGDLYHYNLHDYEKAKEAYLKAVEMNQIDLPYWNRLGDLYKNHLQEYEKAVEAYLKAVEYNQSDYLSLIALGDIYQNHLNKFTESIKAYLKATSINKNDGTAWNNLGNLYQNHLQEYNKAEKAYLKAININSKDATPWNNLGNLYQNHLQKYDEAKDAYIMSITIDSKYSMPWNGLGNLYMKHFKEYDSAKDAYQKSIEISPLYSLPWNNLGNLYLTYYKEYETAEELYLKAVEINKDDPLPLYNLGHLYSAYIEDSKKAETAYLQSIENDAQFEASWYGLGSLYLYNLKDYVKAKEAFLKCIQINPNFVGAWNGLGNYYFEHSKEFEKAEHSFLEAVRIDPSFALSWNGLGNLYITHVKDYKKAEKAFLNAISHDQTYASPWNGLGNLYQDHFNDPKKAKEAYEKAIKIDQNYVAATYNLIFLLRDILLQKYEAFKLFNKLNVPENDIFIDTYLLHKSLFHVYDLNFGLAHDSLVKAILKLDGKTPSFTFDDWIRYATVSIKKGFGSEMIKIFEQNNIHIIMRPFFEACLAFQGNDHDHLLEIAAEVREIAKEIYDRMEKYLN
ncbi:MAG: tetratricopeptide repeat protein [Saprospiraceae bacterium]